ncbi:MAG TPA: hypothetical protein VN770_04315 [Gaiellaceae bacterium]|nr:hypothetical protein [Gaiellaceae bacterium]
MSTAPSPRLEISTRAPALVEVVDEIGADAYVFCAAEIAGH